MIHSRRKFLYIIIYNIDKKNIIVKFSDLQSYMQYILIFFTTMIIKLFIIIILGCPEKFVPQKI